MIAVLTDSTCDLPPAVLGRLGIHMIPLWVRCAGRTARDWVDANPQNVFDNLVRGHPVSTMPVGVTEFQEVYRNLLTHYSGVVSIHISSAMSETVNNARMAVNLLEIGDRVRVIDSMGLSPYLSSPVLYAQNAAKKGLSLDEVERAADFVIRAQYGEFTVPTLEYLRRTGRVSRLQFTIANFFDIRPIMTFRNGKLDLVRRVKIHQAADAMLDSIKYKFDKEPIIMTVGLAGNDSKTLQELKQRAKDFGLNIRAGRTQQIGAVIGAHSGPGLYAFSAEPYWE